MNDKRRWTAIGRSPRLVLAVPVDRTRPAYLDPVHLHVGCTVVGITRDDAAAILREARSEGRVHDRWWSGKRETVEAANAS